MRKIIMILGLILFVGCGEDTKTTIEPVEVVSEAPNSVIGTVDCRMLDDDGGIITLNAKVSLDDGIMRDSFTTIYSIDGVGVDFQNPIVSRTVDNSAYMLESDFYVDNDKESRIHTLELSYMNTNGVTYLYRGSCKQGEYVEILPSSPTNEVIEIQ